MLQPSDRNHLFESLRPPLDYSLDCAVGTTFTLDLLTLLTAPLAFTSFEWADEDGVLSRSPHTLLATLQQYADRISIFCQTGKIALPRDMSLLLSYLEECVIEVNAPHPGGLFHPKIWVLRFTAPEQPVWYRLLCLSRNLTFDRSWDTILLLDGQLTDTPIPDNQPLSDFVGSLPALAHNDTVPQRTRQAVDLIRQELPRVQFELPAGFRELKFHPIGISERGAFPIAEPIDRLLIVSPFVSDDGLQRIGQVGNRNVLVSRNESLAKLQTKTLTDYELFELSPYANPEDEEVDTETGQPERATLSGLHAKLYVADSGSNARIWTGSANATDAAFKKNVEFLVELVGAKKNFGISALMAPAADNEVNFRSLLEPFTPPAEPLVEPVDELEHYAEQAQSQILRLRLRAVVSPLEDELNRYCLELHIEDCGHLNLSPQLRVQCYPLGSSDLAVQLADPVDPVIQFSPLSCEAITSFMGFEVWSRDGKRRLNSFVMNVPIEGVPEQRRQRILRALLSNKNQVLRLLMFLLTDSRTDARELMELIAEGDGPEPNSSSSGHDAFAPQFPLLEAMLKALSNNPSQLDRIESLVKDLRQIPDDEQQLLPDDFEEIWNPIYAVRQKLDL
jgi:hypothetical protein